MKDYGEERFAKNIARGIVKARTGHRISTTGELAKIVEENIPPKFRHNGPCARKTFQAIRIEVNGELEGLADAVMGLTRRLKKGGRICILTFHSLEDRIVKMFFANLRQIAPVIRACPYACAARKKRSRSSRTSL